MHELSVTENILEIVRSHAERASAKKVTDIYLVIGQLSSILDDSVQFYWDLMTKETVAEGANTALPPVPILIQCKDCKNSYYPGGWTTSPARSASAKRSPSSRERNSIWKLLILTNDLRNT